MTLQETRYGAGRSDVPTALAGFVVLEAVAALSAGGSVTLLLADVVLVPAGVIAGVTGLVVLARRRRGTPADAPPSDGRARSQRFSRLVHGLLLGNLGVFGLVAAAGAVLGGSPPALLLGPILVASTGIPVAVAATWWSASDRATLAREAAALRTAAPGARLVTATRRLAQGTTAAYAVLAALAGLAFLFT